VRSRRRNVTVMFSDIVEFTPHAEDLPEAGDGGPAQPPFRAARCLHRPRAGRDRQIHRRFRHGGGGAACRGWTITPTHAVRAALAIAPGDSRGQCDRPRRRAACDPRAHRAAFRPVVVGNICAPGRVNFTVVGDTVNIAQRFEQLGKEFMKDGEEMVVLVSGDTLAAVKDRDALGIGSAHAGACASQGA